MKQRFRVFRYLAAEILRCAWTSLKNGVKVLLGRPGYFDERGLFLRQYLLHLTGLRTLRAITCRSSSSREGAGANALMTMNTIAFARTAGLTYLHTPFTVINHGGEEPMHEWVAQWEDFFNLGAGEPVCDGDGRKVASYIYTSDLLGLWFGGPGRAPELARGFGALIPEFRSKYYRNSPPRATRDVTIAIHVRRGDVSSDSFSSRYTGTEKILRTLSDVKSILDARGITCRIDVYSNGNRSEFRDFSSLGAALHLAPEVDAFRTMRELIEADILITAKTSTFSLYAGLISEGIKVFEPKTNDTAALLAAPFVLPSTLWMHICRPADWIQCGADGSLDRASFEAQLGPVWDRRFRLSARPPAALPVARESFRG